MPTYKFTYFDLMGLGEPARYLMKYGNIQFEDNRIKFEQWPALKPTTQFGQLPILEVDGKKLNQSVAICKYLGKQVKLDGRNDWESAEIDAIVGTIQDMRLKVAQYLYAEEDKKEKMLETLKSETLPYYFEKFETIAKNNSDHFVGSQLTWADVFFVALLEFMDKKLNMDVIGAYPHLQKMRQHVNGLAGIKEWIAVRPKTPF